MCDKIRNSLHTLLKYLISDIKGLEKRSFFVDDRKDFIIWDSDKSIYLFTETFKSLESIRTTTLSFECEWFCHYSNYESTKPFRYLSNNRSSTSTSTTTETTGNKYHICTSERLFNLLARLFSSFFSDFWICSCSESSSCSTTDIDTSWSL